MQVPALTYPAVYVARERQQHEEQQRADKREAARQCLTHYQRGGIVQRRGADRSKAEVKHLALTGVLPAAAVEPERAEHQHRQYRARDAAVPQCLEEAERRDEREVKLDPQHYRGKSCYIYNKYIRYYQRRRAEPMAAAELSAFVHVPSVRKHAHHAAGHGHYPCILSSNYTKRAAPLQDYCSWGR